MVVGQEVAGQVVVGQEVAGQEVLRRDGRPWTDSHCHIQEGYLPESEEIGAVLARAAAAGVGRLVCIGTDLAASRQAVALAASLADRADEDLPRAWATVGLHPHEASQGTGPIEELLAAVAVAVAVAGDGGGPDTAPSRARAAGSVVGVGECGLDYYYEHSPRAVQRQAFEAQIDLAKRLGLALVVHTRDAWDDTLAILAEQGPPARTVIHCFTGGPEEAERCLELGAFLSFSGIATFKSAGEVRAAALRCPPDRLLVETDAPFLAPVPHRGRPNEPALVTVVGEALAALRGVEPAELAATSSAAATEAFLLG